MRKVPDMSKDSILIFCTFVQVHVSNVGYMTDCCHCYEYGGNN